MTSFPGRTTRGRAGAHARKLNRTYRHQWLLYGFATFFIAAPLAFCAIISGHVFLALGVTAFGAWSWNRYTHAVTRMGQTRVGAETEEAVTQAIQASRPHRVILGADLGGPGDVDAVVIHPAGLAVVEIKAGGGTVRVDNGAVITGKGRRIPKDPLRQASEPARALAAKTGLPVTPIVCVRWMRNPAIMADGVIVCGAKELPRVLRGMGHPLDAQRAKRIAAGIRVKR